MITIGFSTRNISNEFIDLLKQTSGISNCEIIPIENNGEYSLTEVYNKIIEQSQNDIIVLCHDDIYFDTKNWGVKILNHFKRNGDFGILGMAGSVSLPKSGMWWEDFSKMRGIVNHEHNGKKWESKYSENKGDGIDDVVLVDGVFIVVNKEKIKTKFNEDVKGFHFYDVDFSFNNFINGVKIGVIYDVRITHKSIGQTNEKWEENRKLFVDKNSDKLPQKIKYDLFNKNKIKVMVFDDNLKTFDKLYRLLSKTKSKISFCGILKNKSDILRLNASNTNYFTLYEPYGYKLGDGKWGLNGMNGFTKSQPNQLYKIKEFDYDLVHCVNYDMFNMIKQIYPNTLIYSEKKDFKSSEELLNEYQNLLNG
jgi:hypothetical protein